MKIVFSAFLMVLSLLFGFRREVIIAHYKLNKDAIAQKYCVNKYRPAMQCGGTCHLKKQLQETDNSEATSWKKLPQVDMLPIDIFPLLVEWYDSMEKATAYAYIEPGYVAPDLDIFRPPPLVN